MDKPNYYRPHIWETDEEFADRSYSAFCEWLPCSLFCAAGIVVGIALALGLGWGA